MRGRLNGVIAAIAIMATLAMLTWRADAPAQQYPVNNPTYTPNAILGSSTLSAPGSVTFQTNGVGTVYFRVAGTNTGVVATVQGTEARAPTTLTWSTVGYQAISTGAAAGTNITANGLYRINVAGFAQVRFNLTAISTGSVAITASGGPGNERVQTTPVQRQSYAASITGLVTAASATDFFTLTGATGITTRVSMASCSGIATTAAVADIVALKRSTANSAGTSTAPTAVPLDANSAAASSTVLAYTANPTTGTLVGNIRTGKLALPLATANVADRLLWDFGVRGDSQPIVLRAATQVFALNGNGATLATAAALDCNVEWTEE